MANATQGDFIWYELMTTDAESAIRFYTEIVGWKAERFDADYTMLAGNQGPVGGAATLGEEAKQQGTPPCWMASVYVDDVDATLALARRQGGRVHKEAADLPNIGRYGVIADPSGAAIGVFKPASAMAAHDNTQAGEFAWNELLSGDHEAAFRFYSALFDWQRLDDYDMGAMGKYLLFGRGERRLGGMFTKSKDMPMPPNWLYYIEVSGLDGSVERAKARGARVLNGPMDVPGGTRMAQLVDAQGVPFALHEKKAG